MGILIAGAIFLFWGIHLGYMLLFLPVNFNYGILPLHLLLQAWLFTGLFITAHDAMHGTISSNRRLNDFVGWISSFMYAGMSYHRLRTKHYAHHLHVATYQDPDYKTGNQNFLLWWIRFMSQYITIYQFILMAVIFNIGLVWFDENKLLLFWVFPSVLSTFQLFYFGTFRPHRLPHEANAAPYFARSQHKNHAWALLSCYFFGYHLEHHQSPQTPWFRLPILKNRSS